MVKLGVGRLVEGERSFRKKHMWLVHHGFEKRPLAHSQAVFQIWVGRRLLREHGRFFRSGVPGRCVSIRAVTGSPKTTIKAKPQTTLANPNSISFESKLIVNGCSALSDRHSSPAGKRPRRSVQGPERNGLQQ